jgi:hypothetical protein
MIHDEYDDLSHFITIFPDISPDFTIFHHFIPIFSSYLIHNFHNFPYISPLEYDPSQVFSDTWDLPPGILRCEVLQGQNPQNAEVLRHLGLKTRRKHGCRNLL